MQFGVVFVIVETESSMLCVVYSGRDLLVPVSRVNAMNRMFFVVIDK